MPRSPLVGQHPHDQYREIRWGNEPKKETVVEAHGMKIRQNLIELGRLRQLILCTGGIIKAKRPYPHLAIGEKDNRLYIVGGSIDKMAQSGQWSQFGTGHLLCQIDYESNKGGELVYWYHEFEPRFPTLKIDPQGYPRIVGGGYRVERAGIVG